MVRQTMAHKIKSIHKILIPIAALVIVFCNLFLLFGYQYNIRFEYSSDNFGDVMFNDKTLQKLMYPKVKMQAQVSSEEYRVFEKTLEFDGVAYTCKSVQSTFYEDYRYHTEKYSFVSEDGRKISFEAYEDQVYSLKFETATPNFSTDKNFKELVYEYVERYCGSILMDYSGDLHEDYKYVSHYPRYKVPDVRDYLYYDFIDINGESELLVKYANGKLTNYIIEVKLRDSGELHSIRIVNSFPISSDTNIYIPQAILRNAILRYYNEFAKIRAEKYMYNLNTAYDEDFELGDFESIRIFKTPLGEYGARGWIKVTYNKYDGYVYDKETDSFVLGEPTKVTDNIFISTMLTSPDVIAKNVIAIAVEVLCLGYIVTVIVMYIVKHKKSAHLEQEEQTE